MVVLGVEVGGPPGRRGAGEGEAWEGEVLGCDGGGEGELPLGVAEDGGACDAVPELGGGRQLVGERAVPVGDGGGVGAAELDGHVGNGVGKWPRRDGLYRHGARGRGLLGTELLVEKVGGTYANLVVV